MHRGESSVHIRAGNSKRRLALAAKTDTKITWTEPRRRGSTTCFRRLFSPAFGPGVFSLGEPRLMVMGGGSRRGSLLCARAAQEALCDFVRWPTVYVHVVDRVQDVPGLRARRLSISDAMLAKGALMWC